MLAEKGRGVQADGEFWVAFGGVAIDGGFTWALPTFRFTGLCTSKPWGGVWVQMNYQSKEGELGDGNHSPNQQQSFSSQRVV